MSDNLKILHIAAELTPLMSTGGLAEVVHALPHAQRQQGHDTRVVLPRYRAIPDAQAGEAYCVCEADFGYKKEYGALRKSLVPGTEVPLYLIEHEGYFGRNGAYGEGGHDYPDNAERFAFLCLAALHGIPQLDWIPDVIHCHDWHAALVPVYLRTRFDAHPNWRGASTLLTIHNLAFQGRFRAHALAQTGLGTAALPPDLEYHGDINLLKGGILNATKINAVSPRYAVEIQTMDYGEGLEGVLRTRAEDLSGILNGADYGHWNPETDSLIPTNYSPVDLSGKAGCKRALQERLGLEQNPDIPLFGVVSRLTWQKGMDLLAEALPQLFERPAQLVLLGAGDRSLEDRFRHIAAQYPTRFKLQFAFDRDLSHWIQAGCDFLLMPSRFEPCGLSQIYAMKYGTVPIVRRTGGLADTVKDWNEVNRRKGTATGLCFVPRTPQALLRCLHRALDLYTDQDSLARVRAAAMRMDFSWEASSRKYTALYEAAIGAARLHAPLYIGS